MNNDIAFSEYIARVRDFIHLQAGPWEEFRTPAPSRAEAQFNELALSLFALQFRHNPVLRPLCESRGLRPECVTDWRQIPAVPTAAFKDYEVTTLPPAQRTTLFLSSGTTEQRPSRHFHDAASLSVYESSLLPWFQAHLLAGLAACAPSATATTSTKSSERMSLICLTPSPALAPHSSLVHMMETVSRSFPWRDCLFGGRVEADGAWTLDMEQVVSALEKAATANAPLALLGTAFGFVHLLDYLAAHRRRFRLPAGSRVMETGGYKGRSRGLSKTDLHTLISQSLGIPEPYIVCEYGMSELSSQAYDRPAGFAGIGDQVAKRVFRFPPWARAQIISPETGREVGHGETGLIRVFDLANVHSVLAVQTEDLGVRRDDGLELLGRVATATPRGCSLMSADEGRK